MMTFKNLFFYAKGSSGSAGGGGAGGGGGGGGGGTGSDSKSTTKKEISEKTTPKKKEKGESVSQVKGNETYEIYRIQNGKEEYVKDQSGSVIPTKMHYDKNRGVWISNQKGYKYSIRKKNK